MFLQRSNHGSKVDVAEKKVYEESVSKKARREIISVTRSFLLQLEEKINRLMAQFSQSDRSDGTCDGHQLLVRSIQ